MGYMPASNQTIKITQVAAEAIIDKLGTDLIAIDLTEQLVLSDVFLIATGQNVAQVDSIADEVERKLSQIGEKPVSREAGPEWILLDYCDLVVHIQSVESRRYYMLDRLWNDCPTIELDAVRAAVIHGR